MHLRTRLLPADARPEAAAKVETWRTTRTEEVSRRGVPHARTGKLTSQAARMALPHPTVATLLPARVPPRV